tara:strand:+ start:2126 stop:2575 length:450 start_codon:yes stop_codon:yes gene_type:complete
MIIRRCSQGHHIRLHKNNTKGVKRTKTYKDGTIETLTYPSSYSYFIDVGGEVVKKTNSFKVAEEFYVDECSKKHSNGHGRLIVGKHHVVNGVATSQSDYPTMDNTKVEIQDFYEKRNISFSSSETKSELLSRIVPQISGTQEVSKHIKV